jgi:hypothetical protein
MKRSLISMLGIMCSACTTQIPQTFHRPPESPQSAAGYSVYPYTQQAQPPTVGPAAAPVTSTVPTPQAPTPSAPLPAAPTTNAPTPQSPTASPSVQQQGPQASTVSPAPKAQPTQPSAPQAHPVADTQSQPAAKPASTPAPHQASKASHAVTVNVKQPDSKTLEQLHEMFPQQQPSN